VKFLCVCEGGNVRSVSLTYVLKYEFDQEALAASWAKCSQETLDMLGGWADKIVLMQPRFGDKFVQWKEKLLVVDVGQDRWGNPFHPELKEFLSKVVQEWYDRKFKF
jgi:hypothetical protein